MIGHISHDARHVGCSRQHKSYSPVISVEEIGASIEFCDVNVGNSDIKLNAEKVLVANPLYDSHVQAAGLKQ